MTQVVLASASPRRRELLRALVQGFDVAPADIDERTDLPPLEAATLLAVAKALTVAANERASIVIGADTLVFTKERVYGKPRSGKEAREMLRALRGKSHTVVTGVAFVSLDGSVHAAKSEASVTIAPLSDSAIEAYLASGRPLDKAGAYAIQDEDVPTVSALEGCYCAVMGLPLWRLRDLLEAAGCATAEPGATFERCRSCPERR